MAKSCRTGPRSNHEKRFGFVFFVFFNEAGFCSLYFVIVHELLPNNGGLTASYIEGARRGNIKETLKSHSFT